MIPPLAGNSSTRDNQRLALRRRIREKRRNLPEQDRQLAEWEIAKRLGKLGAVLRARRMAVYLSVDGELELETAMSAAKARKTLIYAPVLDRDNLRFAPLRDDTDLRENRLGVTEPMDDTYLDPRRLDIILTPLVAFDDRGTRVGMGGGHYDRCFSFLASRSSWFRPKLIGVGYEFQRLPNLERRAWDIPLWAAVTERDIYRF